MIKTTEKNYKMRTLIIFTIFYVVACSKLGHADDVNKNVDLNNDDDVHNNSGS